MSQVPLRSEVSRSEALDIDATSIQISPAARRKSFYIRNISTAGQVISIARSNDKDAVAGSGIVLNVNDAFLDSSSEGYAAWSGRVMAISSAANGILAIEETWESA